MFALGSIDPLLVVRFSGFDLPPHVAVRTLISDGGAGPHQFLQSSGTPLRTATITGVLTEPADVTAFRGYDGASSLVTFRDGTGALYSVWVLNLGIEDDTDWWTFTAELLDSGEVVGS